MTPMWADVSCPACGVKAVGIPAVIHHRPYCSERVVLDAERVAWDEAVVELTDLVGDPDVGPAARTALYCVDEHRADPRMLLAVIRSALEEHDPLDRQEREQRRQMKKEGVEWEK